MPSHAHSLRVPMAFGVLLSLIVAYWTWRIRITKGIMFDVRMILRDWMSYVWKMVRIENLGYDQLRGLLKEDVEVKDLDGNAERLEHM